MKTYNVEIEVTTLYLVTVDAEGKIDAEQRAEKLFDPNLAVYLETKSVEAEGCTLAPPPEKEDD